MQYHRKYIIFNVCSNAKFLGNKPFESKFTKAVFPVLIFRIIWYTTHETVFHHISKFTEKGFEKMTCNGTFWTTFETSGNVVKHCLDYLNYLLNQLRLKLSDNTFE